MGGDPVQGIRQLRGDLRRGGRRVARGAVGPPGHRVLDAGARVPSGHDRGDDGQSGADFRIPAGQGFVAEGLVAGALVAALDGVGGNRVGAEDLRIGRRLERASHDDDVGVLPGFGLDLLTQIVHRRAQIGFVVAPPCQIGRTWQHQVVQRATAIDALVGGSRHEGDALVDGRLVGGGGGAPAGGVDEAEIDQSVVRVGQVQREGVVHRRTRAIEIKRPVIDARVIGFLDFGGHLRLGVPVDVQVASRVDGGERRGPALELRRRQIRLDRLLDRSFGSVVPGVPADGADECHLGRGGDLCLGGRGGHASLLAATRDGTGIPGRSEQMV